MRREFDCYNSYLVLKFIEWYLIIVSLKGLWPPQSVQSLCPGQSDKLLNKLSDKRKLRIKT